MVQITPAESKVLLTLFRDFNTNYNANTLAKKIGITRAGALKICKQLKAQDLLKSQRFGAALFYKLNLEDSYAKNVIETLLMSEARSYAGRWLFEFKDLLPVVEIIIIFGSALRDYDKAKDIDLVLVFIPKNLKRVQEVLAFKNKILPKRIHPIIQSPQDLQKNLDARDEVLLNAMRFGQVLSGYKEIIEVVRNVTRF